MVLQKRNFKGWFILAAICTYVHATCPFWISCDYSVHRLVDFLGFNVPSVRHLFQFTRWTRVTEARMRTMSLTWQFCVHVRVGRVKYICAFLMNLQNSLLFYPHTKTYQQPLIPHRWDCVSKASYKELVSSPGCMDPARMKWLPKWNDWSAILFGNGIMCCIFH